MSDDNRDIVHFYSRNAAGEHRRLEEHQLEYDLTWRYLEKYLPPEGAVLEIGAATGRYTLELAKRGYRLTAVDLTPALLEENRQNLARAGLESRVRLVAADARDLSAVSQTDFAAVLLMGPLYHLFTPGDRRLAVQNAFDRLRPGGVIFSAFISRYGILGDLLKNVPEWIEQQDEVRSILQNGVDPADYHLHNPESFRGYFAVVAEIAPLHEAVGFETLALAGVEPAISADDESYNRLEGARRRLWLDLLYEISTERSILAASRHLLYIGRKPPA